MNEKYIVSDEYLKEHGLDLNDYALDGTLIPAIKNIGLELLIDRICYNDDTLKGEDDIEKDLDENPKKVKAFYKAQYRVIYNLIFQNETSPIDQFLDYIIVFQLGWGKINSIQKGIYFKQNQ